MGNTAAAASAASYYFHLMTIFVGWYPLKFTSSTGRESLASSFLVFP